MHRAVHGGKMCKIYFVHGECVSSGQYTFHDIEKMIKMKEKERKENKLSSKRVIERKNENIRKS